MLHFSGLSGVPAAREPALPVFAFGMWMLSWAKPDQ
jgi:hypothetical protein